MMQRLCGREQLAPSAPCRMCRRKAGLSARAATAVPTEFKQVAPVGERVFVRIDVPEQKSAGGILLPTLAVKKATQGIVASPGSAQSVKEGERVVYSKYAGTEITLDKQDHVILKEDDIIGLLPSDDITQLKPLGDRLLISVKEAADRSEGGVILAADSKDRPTVGKVVAVGSGKADDKGNVVKPSVSVGDSVLYSPYSGTDFEGKDEKQYVVVKDSDVLAVLS